MARIGHGGAVKSIGGKSLAAFLETLDASTEANMHFGWMFSDDPKMQPPAAARLKDGAATISALKVLGEAMAEAAADEPAPMDDRIPPTSDEIPAGYTYFGQFVDHDITLVGDASGEIEAIGKPDFPPLVTLDSVRNIRTPFLELDSIYGAPGAPGNLVPAPNGARMKIGRTADAADGESPFRLFVPGKSKFNDLPRRDRNAANAAEDREALIGDPRNDENLIVAQLHVAFLKAHNTIADVTNSFDGARTALTLIYQSVVIDDFLHRICDKRVLESIEKEGPRLFRPSGPLYMPIEFAAAAFRFGHSMVRTKYDFNLNFSSFGAEFAFTFSALSGELGDFDTFPDNWILQWQEFISIHGSSSQRARPIDPRLTPILFKLRDVLGNELTENIAKKLAIRNLLRGYLFSLPTGQAMARRVDATPIEVTASTTGLPQDAVQPFLQETPLWLYILTEARLNNGKLGAVGGRIVAETLRTLVQRSSPSIFDANGKRRSSVSYRLSDIINLAAVQDTDKPEPPQ